MPEGDLFATYEKEYKVLNETISKNISKLKTSGEFVRALDLTELFRPKEVISKSNPKRARGS